MPKGSSGVRKKRREEEGGGGEKRRFCRAAKVSPPGTLIPLARLIARRPGLVGGKKREGRREKKGPRSLSLLFFGEARGRRKGRKKKSFVSSNRAVPAISTLFRSSSTDRAEERGKEEKAYDLLALRFSSLLETWWAGGSRTREEEGGKKGKRQRR